MKQILLLLIIPIMVSCVSMKKYSSVNQSYANLRKDSANMASKITDQNSRIDDLTRRNISLGQDSLRLYSELTTLLGKYENDSEESRQEIVRLNAQLYGNSKRNYQSNSSVTRVIKIANALSKSMNTLAEELKTAFFNYNNSLYDIQNNNWELVITLRDSLLYPAIDDNGTIVYDHRQLTKEGESILSKMASLIVEKDNFDVVVRESMYLNSPNLTYIPSAKVENIKLTEMEIAAMIDTIIYVNPNVSSKPKDSTLSGNAVIDVAKSNRIDSVRAALEVERLKRKEVERLAAITREKERISRRAADRTSIVMRNLMKSCYYNMGKNKISRDISYKKATNLSVEQGGIEIILRPNIEDLYNNIKNLDKKTK